MKKLLVLLIVASATSYAQTSRPDSHAPIGVMGDHTHAKGEFMFSYRFMNMYMEDNLIGSDDITPEQIVTTVPNRFGMPPMLRVVPVNMTMNMHMLGMMYAPSDKITLMVMGMYNTYTMDHTTYQGMMGSTELGEFTTESSGLGDTKVSALINLKKTESSNLIAKAGFSLPTGSIDNTATILTPMNMQPEVRSPYPMQLGSGSFEFNPGLTYVATKEKFSWGVQASSALRINDNSEDYKLGNQVDLTGWFAYPLTDWISTSVRVAHTSRGTISGIDDEIALPVQTANPDFQGGSRTDALLGVNLIGQGGFVENIRLALEYALPFAQDLNGPQLATQRSLTLGVQYAF